MLRKNVAGQRVELSLFKSGAIIANPTLAAGDVKIRIDGAGAVNVTTLPTSDAAGTVIWLPTQAETNFSYMSVLFNDAAGAEWEPVKMSFDTNIETIAGSLPASVWAYSTRTLSSFGTLIADMWAYATRTLTSTVAATTAALVGSDLTVTAAVTFDATLSSLTIPATWVAILFTAKRYETDADADAEVQIRESNPGVAADGLIYLNGAAGTAVQGSLTVSQSAGTIAIHITDNATALFTRALSGGYDIELSGSDGESTLLTAGAFAVQLTETKAIV